MRLVDADHIKLKVLLPEVRKLGAVLNSTLTVINSDELDVLAVLSNRLLEIKLDVQNTLLSDVLEADSAGKLGALTTEHGTNYQLNSPTGLYVGSLRVLLFYSFEFRLHICKVRAVSFIFGILSRAFVDLSLGGSLI